MKSTPIVFGRWLDITDIYIYIYIYIYIVKDKNTIEGNEHIPILN